MILTQQLQEPEDWLHDNDHEAHLALILVLVSGARLPVGRGEVLLRVGFPPVRVEGFLGGRRGLQELFSYFLCDDYC